jgi:hypothetical protein
MNALSMGRWTSCQVLDCADLSALFLRELADVKAALKRRTPNASRLPTPSHEFFP